MGTGRGPLSGNWRESSEPVMTAYKLVTVQFKWWGLQNKVESFIHTTERRIFTNFHREVFCWMDKWHGMTMADIRALEEETKAKLDEERNKGEIKGTAALEVGGRLNVTKELATISTTVTSLCLSTEASKGTVTSCFLV